MRKTKGMTVQHMPITTARRNLGDLARRVIADKQYFILEKDGIPVMAIMSPDEFEDYLELHDPIVKSAIRSGHRAYLTGKTRPVEHLTAELRQIVVKQIKPKARSRKRRST